MTPFDPRLQLIAAQARERLYIECPKCGARAARAKHGISASGIDLRGRAERERRSQSA